MPQRHGVGSLVGTAAGRRSARLGHMELRRYARLRRAPRQSRGRGSGGREALPPVPGPCKRLRRLDYLEHPLRPSARRARKARSQPALTRRFDRSKRLRDLATSNGHRNEGPSMSQSRRRPVGTVWRGVRATAPLIVSVLIGVAPASAHVFDAPTHLTIQVRDSTVSGVLVARPECRDGQTVRLIVNGQVIASTTTDAKGRYAFAYTPQPPVRIQTRFGGSQSGNHPHRHICRPSESRLVSPGAVRGASGTNSNGVTPLGATGSTGADIQVPLTVAVICLLLGTGLLLLGRRRNG
jgi:hypothetical protein